MQHRFGTGSGERIVYGMPFLTNGFLQSYLLIKTVT